MTEEPVEIEEAPIGRRCYVGNLAWKTSWQDLKDAFRECGTVVYANVMQDHNGRSKGWGIVEFETAEEAAAACKTMNGTELAGRTIMVREDREDRDVKAEGDSSAKREPRAPRGPREYRERKERAPRPPRDTSGSSGLQVVVQGIPWSYDKVALENMFTSFKPEYQVESAEVVYGRDGHSRGYGTVRFATPEMAEMAIADFHNYELESRTLTVKLDQYA